MPAHLTESESDVWARDAMASIVVFLIALPLCMAISLASGTPTSAGLISAIVGGIVVGWMSGCPLQVSGPAAGLTVVVAQLVEHHGLERLGVVVALAGAAQVAAASMRLGRFFRAVPPAVIHGMLAAIGVLLIVGQTPVALESAPVALATAGVMLAWPWLARGPLAAVPAPLAAVLAGSGVAAWWHLSVRFVDVPRRLVDGVRMLSWPALLAAATDPAVLGAALVVAVVASAESLFTAVAIDRLAPESQTDYDRELLAQGAGNLLCGLLGGLPVTGVIARSKANVDAGARSRRAAMLHGVWILLVLAFVPGALRVIPIASLAAVLVMTGVKLVDLKRLQLLAAQGGGVLATYAVTVAGVVALDLLKGVTLGLAAAALHLLCRFAHLCIVLQPREDGALSLHLEGAATFLSMPRLVDVLEKIPRGTVVEIHLHALSVDPACRELLEEWRGRHESAGGRVHADWASVTAPCALPDKLQVVQA